MVWICTWTAEHLDAVEAAVERGRAVFCEKPLAPTFDDCVRVAELLERVPHQVGLVLRHAPVFATVADIVARGRYGPVLCVVAARRPVLPDPGDVRLDLAADVRTRAAAP